MNCDVKHSRVTPLQYCRIIPPSGRDSCSERWKCPHICSKYGRKPLANEAFNYAYPHFRRCAFQKGCHFRPTQMDMVYRYAYSAWLQSRVCSVSRSAALNLSSAAKQLKSDVSIATYFHEDVKILNEINMIMD